MTRILLIEDNPGDAGIAAELLTDASPEAHLVTVTTLAEALASIREQTPNIILLDLGLPDARGVDAVERVRAEDGSVPIVVLTGTDDYALALSCIEAGADDYLVKDRLRAIELKRALGYALSRQREKRIRTLERSLEQYRALGSAAAASRVTRSLVGGEAVRTRFPQEFERLAKRYRDLMNQYVEHLVVRKRKPSARMAALATLLGDLGAAPRDLIDLHVTAMESSLRGAQDAYAREYAVDARLFALEMMGQLVDFYWMGVRRIALEDEKT